MPDIRIPLDDKLHRALRVLSLDSKQSLFKLVPALLKEALAARAKEKSR